jgi:Holliday junction resolvase RusA-like endonuclease
VVSRKRMQWSEARVLERYDGGYTKLMLPIPPSGNRAVRHVFANGSRRHYVPNDVAAYYEGAFRLGQAHKLKPIVGDVLVEVTWYRATRAGDLENRLKVLFDALAGARVFVNDKQIRRLVAERVDGDDQPRMVVRVSALASAEEAA